MQEVIATNNKKTFLKGILYKRNCKLKTDLIFAITDLCGPNPNFALRHRNTLLQQKTPQQQNNESAHLWEVFPLSLKNYGIGITLALKNSKLRL